MKRLFGLTGLIFFIGIFKIRAQQTDSLPAGADLQTCIHYALQHYPLVNEYKLDEEIVRHEIRSRLSDWYPQLNLDYSLQHSFKLQTSYFQGTATQIGVKNTSTIGLAASQNIFSRDVLLASRTANAVRTQAGQFTQNTEIYVILNTGKAFYEVLLTQQQINLSEVDILRLQRAYQDSYNQYKAGVVDKTDYKRAQIELNNSLSQKKQYEEQLQGSLATLKQLMGYPSQASLYLKYDSTQLEQDVYIDTLQPLNYNRRIEFQLLQTQRQLLQANLRYYKWAYIPSVSAYGNYNFNYLNDKFSKLYDHNFRNSYAGLTLSFPIFQGFKRTEDIKVATLELKRVDYNEQALKDSINAEYQNALADYKTYLTQYLFTKENLALAQDVYNTIYLQYRSGVKTYLDVIIAESDLRNTQVNYLNALYLALSSKLDVQKAIGNLTPETAD